MPCYKPLIGYMALDPNSNGKRSIVFKKDEALSPLEISLPCGNCIGCKLDRARMWAFRIMNEASLYGFNCFVTLTYNDLHKPLNGSLVKEDLQKFIKRVRKYFNKKRIRFFASGEYGSERDRPHYHICFFGIDFRFQKDNCLDKLWSKGFTSVGNLEVASAEYVARYVLKKLHKKNDSFYNGKVPEFILMSRKPGIGGDWYNKFYKDLFPSGFGVNSKGFKVSIPRFYLDKYSLTNKESFDKLKLERMYRAFNCKDNTADRLEVRHLLARLKAKRKERKYENGSKCV